MCAWISNVNRSARLLLLLAALALFSSHTVDCGVDAGAGGSEVQWQTLTKLNYPSQIRVHPHLLLLVTVPWSGESRSLMKELAHMVASDEVRFGTLKLMVLYRNVERMLADALGKGYFATDFKKENNGTVAAEEKANRKVDGSFLLLNIMGMEDEKLSCGIDSGFSGISWPSQFTSVNHSLAEAENSTFSDGDSCTLYEFQQFEVFLQKLVIVAREFFLPPERVRFSVVQERSLLSLLDIVEPGSGLMTVYFPGCPSCSKLEDDPQGVEATLPEKRPTMLLFVDRSSNSMQIRLESQKALNALRELAERTEMLNQNRGQSTIRNGKTSMEINRASWSTPKHPRIKPFAASQKVILNDKMSIMLMNEGQQVTLENLVPDLQGSSVHEILTYALKRQKELKLSSLAKDAGFQLLSKDFDIEVIESLPSHTRDQSKRVSGETPVCDGESADIDKKHIPAVSSSKLHEELPDQSDVSEDQSNPVSGETPVSDGLETADIDKKQIPAVSSSKLHEELPDPSDVKYILQDRKEDFLDKSSLSPVEHESSHHSTGMTTDSTESWNVRETRYSGFEENAEKGFTGSFYFLDGQYRLLETLTGGTKIPSVVIVDPISQKHYVLPEQDSQRPPFVNLDFHETDSIPLVTTNTFAELVLGNKSDPKNSGRPWDRNVLVLFSNSWCGFCQRMELIVREVYRAVKSYGNIKINSTRKEKLMLTEYVGDAALNLPLIYMMDCTLNDCSLIVKPILQREVYPLLLLFPAERKNNTVSYEGEIAVSDIIKFLAAHGSRVLDLLMDKKPEIYKTGSTKPQLFAGCVLSATDKLLDAHPFDESKILLVKVHQSTGFQGLIVNKHINWDSLENLEEGYELLKEGPLSFGGPVVMRGMPLVALTHKFIEGQSIEVLPNIYFIDQLGAHSLLEEIRVGNQSVYDYWFFLGYSSWGWEQLFHEIAQGAWNISKGNLEQLEWPWK
ncbi:hypothetical protein Sango_1056400 [Sesamum angolense]|uniref:Thioredoxin domain-containing protein n=1 Tax=Sesamum angolense TaxID=2727404 RepID=A0AAE2BZ60_9LAMI|nr:hypothetical protein Sango_1056400 [Sesamum angolense]